MNNDGALCESCWLLGLIEEGGEEGCGNRVGSGCGSAVRQTVPAHDETPPKRKRKKKRDTG